MLCEWMKTNYLKRYCGQTLKVNEEVADRNQDGLTGAEEVARKLGCRNWIEVAGDICLRRSRPTPGCTADYYYYYYILKLKSHKSPGIDQIPAELIKEGCRTIRSQIHKLIVSIWNKEELLPEEWKESIIVPIHKKGVKTDWNNYRSISFLPTTYKILSNILLSRLTLYAE